MYSAKPEVAAASRVALRSAVARPAYSEILADEKKHPASAFWTRAQNFSGQAGITVQRVLTDNGSCYRSRTWASTLADAGITHKRTRPYRPQHGLELGAVHLYARADDPGRP